MYSQLTNQSLHLADQLKLLRYSWCHTNVQIPDKSQVLFGILNDHLVDQHSRSVDDRKELWSTLFFILRDISRRRHQRDVSNIFLTSKLCKVFLEELCSHVRRTEYPATDAPLVTSRESLIDCWVSLTSRVPTSKETPPVLAHTFLTNIQNLTSLLSALCQLTYALHKRAQLTESVVDLLAVVLEKYRNDAANLPNPKSVLPLVTRKLLVPMLAARKALEFYRPAISDNITAFLIETLMPIMNRVVWLMNIYEAIVNTDDVYQYIHIVRAQESIDEDTGVSGVATGTQSLRFISAALHLPGTTQDLYIDPAHRDVHAAIRDFLPVIFTQFLHSNSAIKFAEFTQFWETMTKQEENCCYVGEVEAQDLLWQLLDALSAWNIYNIHENKELEFLVSLRDSLIGQSVSDGWFRCMCALLHLNHKTLEDRLADVLRLSWIPCLKSRRHHRECFLSQSLVTYARLHQIPKYLSCLVSMLDDLALPDDIELSSRVPTTFLNALGETTESLPIGVVTRVWRLFTDTAKTCIQDKQSDAKTEVVAELFAQFLLNVRASYSTITVASDQQFDRLLSETRTDVLQPMIDGILSTDQPKPRAVSVLRLCYSWGELVLLLTQYGHSNLLTGVRQSTASAATDISFVHAYVMHKQSRKLLASTSCAYLADLLKIQKLRALLLLCDDPDTTSIHNIVSALVTDDISVEWSSAPARTSTWDGHMFGVNGATEAIARCHAVISFIPVLFPLFTSEQQTLLTDFIVINATTSQKLPPAGHHTIASVCSSALSNPACHELPSFTAMMCHAIWKNVHGTLFHNVKLGSKRRRSEVGCFSEVFASISRDLVSVNEPRSDAVSSLGHVDDYVASMLRFSNSTTVSLDLNIDPSGLLSHLQILQRLPLEHTDNDLQLCNCAALFTSLTLLMHGDDPSDPTVPRVVDVIESLIIRIFDINKQTTLWAKLDVLETFAWLRRYNVWVSNFCVSDTFVLSHKSVPFLEAVVKVVLKSQTLPDALSDFIQQLATEMADATEIGPDFVLVGVLLKIFGLTKKGGDSIPQFIATFAKGFFSFLKSRKSTLLYTRHEFVIARIFSSIVIRRTAMPKRGKKIRKYLPKFYAHAIKTVSDMMMKPQTLVLDEIAEYLSAIRLYLLCTTAEQSESRLFPESHVRDTWTALVKLLTVVSLGKTSVVQLTPQNADIAGGGGNDHFSNDSGKNLLENAQLDDKDAVGLFHADGSSVDGPSDEVKWGAAVEYETGNRQNARERTFENCETFIGQMKVLLPALLATSDSGMFDAVLREITANVRGSNISACNRGVVTGAVLMISILVETASSKDAIRVMTSQLSQILVNLNATLTEICSLAEPDALWDVAIHILTTQNAFVTSECLSLAATDFTVLLDTPHQLLCPTAPLAAFTACFTCVTDRLLAVTRRHHTELITNMAAVFSICKQLQVAIIARGTQDNSLLSRKDETSLVMCANELIKVFSLLTKFKEVNELIVFLVANHLSEMHTHTVFPSIKQCLERGMFCLLDACDDRTIRFMHAALHSGAQHVFKDLHADYRRYHKFAGKI